MKLKKFLRSLFVSAALAAPVLALATPPPIDYVYLSFSGGNNTAPLTINIGTPISFEITSSSAGFSLAIDELGDSVTKFLTTTSFTFSVNGGASIDVDKFNGNNYVIGELTANDAFFSSSGAPALSPGDRIDFTTGTVKTEFYNNYYYAPPADGYYRLFLVNPVGGALIGTPVAAAPVPEPSTYAAIAGVVALAGTVIYSRRRAA
ncbi:MAG: PEP-CTERM sorting domain-containing protein [Verrucomicrobia bacterium]|nr:PEP-CTERM sorting domain-containing protein [Verrucomicrobiota bacterium]